MDFEHPTFQGVTNERALTQGVASPLPYANLVLCAVALSGRALLATSQQFKRT